VVVRLSSLGVIARRTSAAGRVSEKRARLQTTLIYNFKQRHSLLVGDIGDVVFLTPLIDQSLISGHAELGHSNATEKSAC